MAANIEMRGIRAKARRNLRHTYSLVCRVLRSQKEVLRQATVAIVESCKPGSFCDV
jgi:hypothetical protein